jgi:hypothetical protein
MFRIREITYDEYKYNLRKEIETVGLKAAIEKRCDMIDEDCRFLGTATYLGVIESLNDILDLLTIAEEEK